MSSKAVKLPVEVIDQLKQVKEALGLKSLGEASKVLVDLSFSPVGLLALAYDARADVKELLREIKKLNKNLEQLLERLPEDGQQ